MIGQHTHGYNIELKTTFEAIHAVCVVCFVQWTVAYAKEQHLKINLRIHNSGLTSDVVVVVLLLVLLATYTSWGIHMQPDTVDLVVVEEEVANAKRANRRLNCKRVRSASVHLGLAGSSALPCAPNHSRETRRI